jgi:hypothetical protein
MRKTLVFILFFLTAQAMSQSNASNESTTEWIPVQITPGELIIPIKVDGHPATAHLVNGIESNFIDKDFIDKNNIPYQKTGIGQSNTISLTLQIGGLTVNQPVSAILIQHQIRNASIDLTLGDDIFKEFVVDIDFPNKRIAFRSPGGFAPPDGITPFTFKQIGESRAAAASVEGGPLMSYWIYLGDPVPISIHQRYYTNYAILQGRAKSVRMGGGQRSPPEAIATLREVRFAGADFSQVPAVFPDDSVTGDHPDTVAGHIGLGILSRCRIIFDYSHDRLYVIPGSAAIVKAPFPKDRSGLVMRKVQNSFVVRFVCPESPAMMSGFQIGDTVLQINNQLPPSFMGMAWQSAGWSSVRATDSGITYSFMIKDGTVRKLTTTDFF